MERSELQAAAEYLLDLYREILNIDPYFQIKIEITEGDFSSLCNEDIKAASWIVKINPERHNDVIDIQFSVVDALTRIIFRHLERTSHLDEAMSRITTSLVSLLPTDDEGNQDV